MLENKIRQSIEKINPAALVLLGAFSVVGISITAKYLTGFGMTINNQVWLRNLVAAIFMTILFPSWYTKLKHAKLKAKVEIFFRSGTYVAAIYLLAYAFNHTSLIDIGLLSSLPFMAVIGVVFYREKLSKKVLALLVVSFIGGLIVSGFHQAEINLANLCVVAGSFLFALVYVETKDRIGHINNEEFSTMTQVLAAALILLITGLSNDFGNFAAEVSLKFLFISLLCAAFIVLNMLALGSGLKRISSVRGNILMNVIPIFSIVASMFLFGVYPKLNHIVGGAVILIACFALASRRQVGNASSVNKSQFKLKRERK